MKTINYKKRPNFTNEYNMPVEAQLIQTKHQHVDWNISTWFSIFLLVLDVFDIIYITYKW